MELTERFIDALHRLHVEADVEPALPSLEALQAMYLQSVRHVLQHTEDVGEGFVKEVRNIHRGDAPQRAVRGQADQEEVAELTTALGEAAVEIRVWKKSAEGRLGPSRTSR